MTARGGRVVIVAAALLVAKSAPGVPPAGVAMRGLTFKTKTLDLPSGMRIVVEEDRSQPLIAIVTVVDVGSAKDPIGDVGSAKDPIGKEGLAHLVEHLTFRTRPDGKVQRSSLLDFAAAGFWNAYTTHDLTTYVTIGPTEALPQLLSLEGRRLLTPLAGLDARGFEAERGVVRSEISQHDEQGAVSAVESRLYGALYPEGHPYHRPVGGTEGSVSGLTLTDAQTFVQQYYVPRNVTLFVSGDVDLTTIEKVFDANLPPEFLDAPPGGPLAPARRLAESAPVPALTPAGRLETLRAPAERKTLYIAWSLPGGYGAQGYLERFVRSAFASASGGAMTLDSDVEGISTTLDEGRYGNTLICEVLLKEGDNPERSLERVLDQLVRIWQPGLSDVGQIDAENRGFAWLEKTAIVGVALETESITSRATDKATIIHWTGDPLAWGKDMRAMFDLNSAKMQSFAYEWLTRSRARAVFVEPSGGRPASSESAHTPGVFAAADDVRIKIAPEALATYVHGPFKDARNFVLKNGVEVFLVRRASAPTVAVTLGFRGGRATGEPLGAAELAAVIAAPTHRHNGPPAKFGARLRLSSNVDSTFYSGVGASGNLENLLAMMSDGVKSMHVDGGMKGAWKWLVGRYKRNDVLPSTQLDRAYNKQMFSGSPLGRSATAQDIDRLGAGDVETWVEGTLRPRGATMAVVGDIDPVEAEKQIRDWFDGWDGTQDARVEAHSARGSEPGGPIQVGRVDRRGLHQTEIRLGCSMPSPASTDRIALRLLAERISGRLHRLARTNLGESYGFTGGGSAYREASSLHISGVVDDQALTRVLAIARKGLG